jgi:putative transposase
MARLPRLYLPGCAQHVIQRVNNREACFYAEADYKAYLACLKDAAAKGSMGSETLIFRH